MWKNNSPYHTAVQKLHSTLHPQEDAPQPKAQASRRIQLFYPSSESESALHDFLNRGSYQGYERQQNDGNNFNAGQRGHQGCGHRIMMQNYFLSDAAQRGGYVRLEDYHSFKSQPHRGWQSEKMQFANDEQLSFNSESNSALPSNSDDLSQEEVEAIEQPTEFHYPPLLDYHGPRAQDFLTSRIALTGRREARYNDVSFDDPGRGFESCNQQYYDSFGDEPDFRHAGRNRYGLEHSGTAMPEPFSGLSSNEDEDITFEGSQAEFEERGAPENEYNGCMSTKSFRISDISNSSDNSADCYESSSNIYNYNPRDDFSCTEEGGDDEGVRSSFNDLYFTHCDAPEGVQEKRSASPSSGEPKSSIVDQNMATDDKDDLSIIVDLQDSETKNDYANISVIINKRRRLNPILSATPVMFHFDTDAEEPQSRNSKAAPEPAAKKEEMIEISFSDRPGMDPTSSYASIVEDGDVSVGSHGLSSVNIEEAHSDANKSFEVLQKESGHDDGHDDYDFEFVLKSDDHDECRNDCKS